MIKLSLRAQFKMNYYEESEQIGKVYFSFTKIYILWQISLNIKFYFYYKLSNVLIMLNLVCKRSKLSQLFKIKIQI